MQVRLLFRALCVLVVISAIASAQPVQRIPQSLVPTSTARERADFLAKQGNDDSAVVYYRLWTTANPRDTTALLNLARLYAKRRWYDSAASALQAAASAGFSSVGILDTDSLLRPIRTAPVGSRLRRQIEQNALEAAQYPLRFARQERIGRYRILFPPSYDTLQQYNLVLLLHGNGNEPVMMLRWAKALGLERAIIVCPEAPYVKIAETIAQGRMRLSAAADEVGVPDSLYAAVTELSAQWYQAVLDEAKRTLPIVRSSLPIVVGFSQGGFFAQVLATRYPEQFRAVVLLASSYYQWGGIAERLSVLERYGIEVLHVHGRNDPIVPLQTAQLIGQLYRAANVKYSLIEFDGQHWIPDDLARRIGQWIEERFR